MIRAVRLMFVAVGLFAIAVGWFIGSPVPVVAGIVITAIDLLETSFLLLVTTAKSAGGDQRGRSRRIEDRVSRPLLWLARLLLVAGLAVFLIAPGVNGPVLVAVWLLVLVAYRFVAMAPDTRAGKAAVDVGFLVSRVLCGVRRRLDVHPGRSLLPRGRSHGVRPGSPEAGLAVG